MRHGAFPRGRRPAVVTDHRRLFDMTWQTPAATDLRFGFEITMYVSAR
jgi:coenzyme PQQ precursor peptide PqqA